MILSKNIFYAYIKQCLDCVALMSITCLLLTNLHCYSKVSFHFKEMRCLILQINIKLCFSKVLLDD